MIKVNGDVVKVEHFPNGESKIAPINIKLNKDHIFIDMIYEGNEDLIALMFIKKYLDERYYWMTKQLDLLYIPYERMDRETPKQMFTSKYFGQFINSLDFGTVRVFDPHSNVSIASIDKVRVVDLGGIVNMVRNKCNADYLFFPDNGAKKKYAELIDPMPVPYFYGDKHRDLDTGKITDYNVFSAPDLNGKTVLIVDDLCVKGYTTLFAAKKLKELGASKVIFYCSHCEPAIFEGELLTTNYVDEIYTTNSLIREKHPKIHELNI